jgi:hypothetical protein
MMSRLITAVFLTAAATAAFGQGQTTEKDKQKEMKPVPAATQPAGKADIAFAVEGLTPENEAKVQSALQQLTHQTFSCPKCKASMAEAGDCKSCMVPLEAKTNPLFKNVEVSADEGKIALQADPAAHVRLSKIESVLGTASVKVDKADLKLGNNAALVFQGGASAEDATALQTAFKDAKFADARAMFDPKTKEIHVRLASGPTWKAAEEIGSKLTKPLRLTDVAWGTAPMPKG